MTNRDLKTAKALFRKLINEIIERHGKDSIYDLVLESEEAGMSVKSSNGAVFYGIQDFIQVSMACGCSCYVSMSVNKAGLMTPTLHIH